MMNKKNFEFLKIFRYKIILSYKTLIFQIGEMKGSKVTRLKRQQRVAAQVFCAGPERAFINAVHIFVVSYLKALYKVYQLIIYYVLNILIFLFNS